MRVRTLKKFTIQLFSLILICGVANTVLGQTQSVDVETLKGMPFLELVDMKVSLTSEIAELQQIIKEMPKKIQVAEINDRELSRYNDELKKLNDLKVKTPEDKLKIASLTAEINDLKDQIGDQTAATYKAELLAKQKELDDKQTAMQNVRKVLASIYTPEQEFKRTMSGIFAMLIGLVIIGFFSLSHKDEKIRQAIFSGETGIQFLTLFSLVIAIILFGITGILEDKELAALLGGLSGYILGRYNKPGEKERAPQSESGRPIDAQEARAEA
jgi:hypothetical protein